MGYQAPFPTQLEEVEFLRLYFHLEVRADFELPELGLLQLRRELLAALKVLQRERDPEAVAEIRSVFFPDLPDDPVLVRRLQKPAPPLVLAPAIDVAGRLQAGGRILLPVLLFGAAIHHLEDFIDLFEQVGQQGLYKGEGYFFVEAVECEDASGVRSILRDATEPRRELTPPVSDLAWWLERLRLLGSGCRIELLSPLRLLSRGKPLFKADFAALFPFILRRVSSMLAHCGPVDLGDDAGYFLTQAGRLSTVANRLQWKDWRRLKRSDGNLDLGGLMGYLEIAGDELADIAWLLRLASLFNIGKGAAYGAGQFRLIDLP